MSAVLNSSVPTEGLLACRLGSQVVQPVSCKTASKTAAVAFAFVSRGVCFFVSRADSTCCHYSATKLPTQPVRAALLSERACIAPWHAGSPSRLCVASHCRSFDEFARMSLDNVFLVGKLEEYREAFK